MMKKMMTTFGQKCTIGATRKDNINETCPQDVMITRREMT